MGILGLAGAVSGMGQAVEKGLSKYQDYIMASALQKERMDGENLRQGRLNDFTREQNTLSRNQAGDLARLQNETSITTNRRSVEASEYGTRETSTNQQEATRVALELGTEKNKNEREQIRATAQSRKDYVAAITPAKAKLPPETLAQISIHEKEAGTYAKQAEQNRNLAKVEIDPDKKNEYELMAKEDDVLSHESYGRALDLAGVDRKVMNKNKDRAKPGDMKFPATIPPATTGFSGALEGGRPMVGGPLDDAFNRSMRDEMVGTQTF